MQMYSVAIPVLLAITAVGQAQVAPAGPGAQVAATLGQAFAGPVGPDTAMTMVTVTNRDPARACIVGFSFLGVSTTSGSAIFLNEENTPALDLTIPSGGARMVTMTAEELVQGLMDIFVVAPCSPASISVAGNYTILGATGEVREVFTLRPNSESQWLRNGRCLVITTNQDPAGQGGPVQNLGVATSSVTGVPAPPGTVLDAFLFDENGQLIDNVGMPVTGEHTASFPIPASITGKVTVVFCMQSPSTSFELDLTPVKLVQGPGGFQFDNAVFADGFESGDTSAWNIQNP